MSDSVLDRIPTMLGMDPLEVLEHLRVASQKRAKLAASVQTIDHRRKVKLAELRERRRQERQPDERLTEGILDDYALNHPEYLSFLREMYQIVDRHAMADADYWHLKGEFDYLISCINFARAESYALKAD